MQLLQSRPERAKIEIDVFDVMKENYPSDYSKIDAVIISGSTSSAYDADAWIQRLQVHIGGV